MPWDGNGNFVLLQDFPQDRDLGRPDSLIDADKFDSEFENIKAGLEACLNLNGENEPTADLPMGGFTFTDMRAAVASDEPIIASQVSSGSFDWIGTAGGTANAVTGSLTFAPSLAAGVRVKGIAANTNTGATTFSLNGGSLKDIRRINNDPLVAGDLTSGRPFEIVYDGTQWRLMTLQVGLFSGTPTLDELSDVAITSAAVKQTLRYDGSGWVNALLLLDDLSDVVISGATSAQALRYNGSNWVNALLALDDLSDVSITTPAAAQTMRYNGSGWVNSFLSIDDLTEVALGTPSSGHVLGYNGSNWISRTIAASLGYTPANVAGDTFTGNIIVSKSTPEIQLNKSASGQVAQLSGRTSGTIRWGLQLGDDSAESGANAGSDFRLLRYSDVGVFQDLPFTISRATGVMALSALPTVAGSQLLPKSGGTMTGALNMISTSKFLAEGGSDGGQFIIEKPASGTSITDDIIVDINGNNLRIFEGGGSLRGFVIDLTACGAGLGTTIWHSHNDGAGSGLDADLLDGQSSAYYQSASNLNAGTIPVARLGNAGKWELIGSTVIGSAVASVTHTWTADTYSQIVVMASGVSGSAAASRGQIKLAYSGGTLITLMTSGTMTLASDYYSVRAEFYIGLEGSSRSYFGIFEGRRTDSGADTAEARTTSAAFSANVADRVIIDMNSGNVDDGTILVYGLRAS